MPESERVGRIADGFEWLGGTLGREVATGRHDDGLLGNRKKQTESPARNGGADGVHWKKKEPKEKVVICNYGTTGKCVFR